MSQILTIPPNLSLCHPLTEEVCQNWVKSSFSLQHTVFPARNHLVKSPTERTSLKTQVFFVVFLFLFLSVKCHASLCWLTPSVLPRATDKLFAVSENLESRAGIRVCSRFRNMYVWRGPLSGIKSGSAEGQKRQKGKRALHIQLCVFLCHLHYLLLSSCLFSHFLMMGDICTM